MMIKFVAKIVLAGAISAASLIAPLAAAESTYKVELLVFSYLPSDTLDDEVWPPIGSIPARNRARELAYNQADGSNRYFTRLPKNALQLSGEKNHLRRSSDYRILFHEAWVQPVGTIKGQHTLHISGGDILDNGLYELEGFISVEKSRYLHFRSDLFHSRQLTAEQAQLLRPTARVAAIETAPTPAGSTRSDSALPPLDSSNGNRYLTRTQIPDFVTVEMESARRMRRNELHYLDHPLMGALVLISPVGE